MRRSNRSANSSPKQLQRDLSLEGAFVRDERGQRQRVDASRQLICEGLINEPLSCHPALTDEGDGHDRHGEMRFATRASPGVPDVTVRLVLDFELSRGKALDQLAADRIGNGRHYDGVGCSALWTTVVRKAPRLS